MKHRICKLQDGNGKIYYQIQEKRWFFWRYIRSQHPYYNIIYFETLDMAKSWLKDHIEFLNSKRSKILERIEI